MNAYTIKDLENLSGIKAHTIRIWEQRYDFIKPQRSDTNIRYYSNEELKKLLNVALLNKHGYKISHIDKMDAEKIHATILGLDEKDAVEERIINDMIQCMITFDDIEFEKNLDSFILEQGLEQTITNIIFPFLNKVGILWSTNQIIPAQEHIVSNLIRQKIIVAINSLPINKNFKKSCAIFLPEGEYHELGILFISFLMKKNAIKVHYLGASVGFKDLQCLVDIKKPDFLYTHITSCHQKFSINHFIEEIQEFFPEMKLVVSGPLINRCCFEKNDKITFLPSLEKTVDFIESV